MALAFEDQFGIRPLEGYGCTECSPVVTVNGKDFRAAGFRLTFLIATPTFLQG